MARRLLFFAFACVGALDVKMDDPAIVYSPYNWGFVRGEAGQLSAKTINAGAYFRMVFSGQLCILHTDTVNNTQGPFSQFWSRVDGGPLDQHTLSPGNSSFNISLGPPFSASESHLLEVIVKSTSETIHRWDKQTTAVVFSGITVDGPVRAPHRKPYNVLVYGDSITEGVRTLGYIGIQNDTDRNDAVRDYSFQLSLTLPAEVGIVAFGATGLLRAGSGGVPPLPASWDLLWAGKKRDFSTSPPDLIVYNEGTNDSGNITEQFLGVVQSLHSLFPSARQLLLLPFNGCHKTDILAVVAEMKSPNVVFGDTSGFYSGKDGLHPFGYSHIADISPKMAALCLPLLSGANTDEKDHFTAESTAEPTITAAQCATIANGTTEKADTILKQLYAQKAA